MIGRIVVAVLLSAFAAPWFAVYPRVWKETASRLADGETDGLAVTRNGRLFLAPALTALHGEDTEGSPAHVWCVTDDPSGTVFVGTGPDGRILRFGSTGAGRIYFTVDEPMVTALAVTADGDLLAAAAPGGKIYRIDKNGKGTIWAETDRGYIWDLAQAGDGSFYAAAGEPAGVLRISRTGQVADWFETRDAHIVRILPDGKDWIAASSGAGRVYRITPEGYGTVLHQDDLTEASDMVRTPDGTIYVTYLNAPRVEPERPAVTINLSDNNKSGPVGSRADIGAIEDGQGAVIHGVIEGLPTDEEGRSSGGVRGRVVKISPTGASDAIWQSSGAAAFSVALDTRDRVLFGTGEPARIYRYDGEDVALLQTLAGAQANSLFRGSGRALVGTSNPFGLYRFGAAPSTGGVFVSRAFDAEANSHWGTIRWETAESGAKAELYTRTGNSTPADSTWSAWSPALSNSQGSPIVNPEGRYLQWRVRIPSSVDEDVKVGNVAVHYQPFNRPPSIKSLRIDGDPAGTNSVARLRWSVFDPDDDPVRVRFEFRRDGSDWAPLPVGPPADGIFVSGPRKGWREDQLDWDTASVPEGRYQLRAHFSDAASNAPSEGHERLEDLILELAVDRTPPLIQLQREKGLFRIEIQDGESRLQQVQVLGAGQVVFGLRPEDGVLDSGQERFRFAEDALSGLPGPWRLRAIDESGNEAELEFPAP